MPKGKFGIPDRWDKYSPCGRQIEGTPFVAFKVPLAEHFFQPKSNPQVIAKVVNSVAQVSIRSDVSIDTDGTTKGDSRDTSVTHIDCSKDVDGTKNKSSVDTGEMTNRSSLRVNDFNEPWTLKILSERLPNLDVVIDLTFTTKYYKPHNLETARLKYVKIFSKGHEIPNRKVVTDFFQAVESAMRKNKDCLIGVHCTHGVNRTGYLICRYLIQKLKWDPNVAIGEFLRFRGHPIERDLYLVDLRSAKWKDEVVPSLRHGSPRRKESEEGNFVDERHHRYPHHQRRWEDQPQYRGQHQAWDHSNQGWRRSLERDQQHPRGGYSQYRGHREQGYPQQGFYNNYDNNGYSYDQGSSNHYDYSRGSGRWRGSNPNQSSNWNSSWRRDPK